jgi:hypothetical protein
MMGSVPHTTVKQAGAKQVGDKKSASYSFICKYASQMTII